MLELALCLPLVVLLFLATLEIAQLLRVTQLANVLSREAGNAAFRLCADFAEPSGMKVTRLKATQGRSAVCLNQVLTGPDGVQTLADSLGLPFETEIIVSIYRYDDTPNPGTPSLWRVTRIDGGPQIGKSKFSLAAAQDQIIGPNVTIPASEVTKQTRFVVSEVYVRYSKMTPDAFNQFVPSDGAGHAIYYEQTTF